jgi:flagellar hook-associated protein 1
MGLLNSSLQIGRNAILSYQGALQTIGNNVSNVGSPDYTRLAPLLDPIQGVPIAGGLQPGAGVALTGIQRNLDEALEARIRQSIGIQHGSASVQVTLAQVELFFSNLNGTDTASRLSDFFRAFDELQNNPDDHAARDLAISAGARVADSLRSTRAQLEQLGRDTDGQIQQIVKRADEVAREIAKLNGQITASEAGRAGQATALRDRRDALLRELGRYFDVTVREQPNGALNVYVGSEALIQGGMTRGLVATTDSDGQFTRTTVRFADNNQQLAITGGQLGGTIISRDVHAYGRVAALDQLAAIIIHDVNRIHADGQGLNGFRQVVGRFDLLATDVPLNRPDAGLPFTPNNGSFFITVMDDTTQTPVAYRIDVNFDGDEPTTLESLVDRINATTDHVTASVTSDGRLAITADNGFSFSFGHDGQVARTDTSGVLAALGINTFFEGRDARSMAVSQDIVRNPSLIAAASVFVSGDGANAGRIAALDTAQSRRAGGVSITNAYNAIANAVAVDASAANEQIAAAETVLASLQAQKESISGVNLDEEAIQLLKFERAFQGAARYVSTVDQMLGELIALMR